MSDIGLPTQRIPVAGTRHPLHGTPRRGGRNKSGRRPDGENALKILLIYLSISGVSGFLFWRFTST